MYQLSRLMLTAAVALFAYCGALVVVLAVQQVPPDKQGLVWITLAAGTIILVARKKVRSSFTAMGTAAWASAAQMARAGMLHANSGLILGRIKSDGSPLGQAVGRCSIC